MTAATKTLPRGSRKLDARVHKALRLTGGKTAPKYSTNGKAYEAACTRFARELNLVVNASPVHADGAEPGDPPTHYRGRAYVLGQEERYVVCHGATPAAAGCSAAVELAADYDSFTNGLREVLPTRLHVAVMPERVWADPKSVGAGCAPTRYLVDGDDGKRELEIVFQDGDPRRGVNGTTNEALLAIVLDRLERFQVGPFACSENLMALGKVEKALEWLRRRATKRHERGVLGKAEK